VTRIGYEILQAPLPRVRIALPAGQTLTQLENASIRDWHIGTEEGHPLLTVEFLKPMEQHCELILQTEQSVDPAGSTVALIPPQPLGLERETGAISITAEDVLLDVISWPGLRQSNATGKSQATYRFFGRPFNLEAALRPVEPLLNVSDRVM